MTYVKRQKGWRMSCDVGEVTERLEHELYLRHSSFSNPSVASPASQLILQPFFHFSYVTGSSLNSHGEPPMQSSFSKLSVASPTSQLIIQPFRRFTYVTTRSPFLPLLHLHHSSFSNPSFASPTSQALHLRHLASRPWGKGGRT